MQIFTNKKILLLIIFFLSLSCFAFPATAQNDAPRFKVIAFYTAKNDLAHISFVHEANKWFDLQSEKIVLRFDSNFFVRELY